MRLVSTIAAVLMLVGLGLILTVPADVSMIDNVQAAQPAEDTATTAPESSGTATMLPVGLGGCANGVCPLPQYSRKEVVKKRVNTTETKTATVTESSENRSGVVRSVAGRARSAVARTGRLILRRR